MRIAIGIATSGRRTILTETLLQIYEQVRLPDIVCICPALPEDYDEAAMVSLNLNIVVVKGKKGSAPQRNAILKACQGFDILLFIDDDFFLQRHYLVELEHCFTLYPDVVAVSGLVVADGVTGPGIDTSTARKLLSEDRTDIAAGVTDQYNAYGCNMGVRLHQVLSNDVIFDEKLPLYGWLEDVDFCRRLSKYGRVVKYKKMIGVHLGTKSGRTSGIRFGYSQIANPIYIWLKGSTGLTWVLRHILSNLLANIRWYSYPEPWIDRRGRLKGNFIAFHDLFLGRLDPSQVLYLD